MKLLSLFSGIGAFEKALDNLQIPYELVGYCEIDKYASKSYAEIHGVPEAMNLGDITKVNEKALPKNIDLITYGFPCQDISIAGNQKGLFNADGTQTRSGLFFDALRIIEEAQPKVAIAENVKNLTSKKFSQQFGIVLDSLEQAGYNSYWQVLNAKDYGIPQNRERVFIVSIRKDIDTGFFQFPKGFPLELRLKDMLEEVVDEKFYLSDASITEIQNSTFVQEKSRIQNTYACQTPLARDYKDTKCILVERTYKTGATVTTHLNMETEEQKSSATKLGNVYNDKFDGGGDFGGNVWDKNGLAPTLKTSAAASQQFVMVEPRQNAGIIIDDTQGFDGTRYYKDYSPSLRASRSGLKTVDGNLRIRKLTPKECFRLQGFDDESFHKAEAVNSNTQLYKQAGNSICVPVVEYITKALIDCGAFGGEAKHKEPEGQLSFADSTSFERYVDYYTDGGIYESNY